MSSYTKYLQVLKEELERNEKPKVAVQQKAYMRNQFEFYGIKSPERRLIQRPFLKKDMLPPKKQLSALIKELWTYPQRDYQYFAQELAAKYMKEVDANDILLYEHMVLNKSWWDTIDFIAVNLMGNYFKQFPEQCIPKTKEWLQSGNFWLQRCALLFQLKYKKDLDTQLLANTISYLLGSKEFFINKAIGWILREYTRTNAQWVVDFVDQYENKLSNLSKREALRLIK